MTTTNLKAERIEAVKAACAAGIAKSGATGAALEKAQREAAAMIEILEAKHETFFIGFEGDAGVMQIIKTIFMTARAKAAA